MLIGQDQQDDPQPARLDVLQKYGTSKHRGPDGDVTASHLIKLSTPVISVKLLTGGGNGLGPPQSMPARVLAFLSEHPGFYTAKQVTEGMNEPDKLRLIASSLFRLAKTKKISNPSWGKYSVGGGHR